MADPAHIYRIEQLLFEATHALDGIATYTPLAADEGDPCYPRLQELAKRAAAAQSELEQSTESLLPDFQFAMKYLQGEPDEDPAMY